MKTCGYRYLDQDGVLYRLTERRFRRFLAEVEREGCADAAGYGRCIGFVIDVSGMDEEGAALQREAMEEAGTW